MRASVMCLRTAAVGSSRIGNERGEDVKILTLAHKYFAIRLRLRTIVRALKGTEAYEGKGFSTRNDAAYNALNEIWAILDALCDAEVIDADVRYTAQDEVADLYYPHLGRLYGKVKGGEIACG